MPCDRPVALAILSPAIFASAANCAVLLLNDVPDLPSGGERNRTTSSASDLVGYMLI